MGRVAMNYSAYQEWCGSCSRGVLCPRALNLGGCRDRRVAWRAKAGAASFPLPGPGVLGQKVLPMLVLVALDPKRRENSREAGVS